MDSDPTTVEAVLALGVAAVLVATPSTYPGENKDETIYRPWYSLVEKVEEQNMARATKMMEEENAANTTPPT